MAPLRLLGLALLLAACQPGMSPIPSQPGSSRVEIPTRTAEAPGVTCGGGAYTGSMKLTGEATASPSVWLDWMGATVPIHFPVGYYATFDPGLTIHDPAGAPVVREGAEANANPRSWTGLYICIDDNPPVVRVYRLADVLPQPANT